MLNRLWSATVWSRDGVPTPHWRFRGIFRFVLPLTDLLFMYFGIVGWTNGVASVQESAGALWQAWWSAGIAVAALAAFVGVAVPRLWRVEVVGKIFLIGLVAFYVALFLARGIDDTNVTATAGLMVILVLMPLWRVVDLGFEAWESNRRRP